MGLFGANHEYDFSNNSTNIRFPDRIDVHEHKAPTDQSIKLMEEMHDKALKNIIAKVKVENNLVSGECFLINQPWNIQEFKMIFKFKINNQEFKVEKEFSKSEFSWDDQKQIAEVERQMEDRAKGIMVWYALRKFTQVAYEQITQHKLPDRWV